MNLELTDEQAFFRDTTRRFLETEAPLTTVRELYDTVDGFDRGWWKQAAELGFTSMFVPEAIGGGSLSGSPTRDAVIVAEEMGRLVSPGPFLPVNVVAASLAWHGSDAQRNEVLPGLLSGETVAAWAHAEPGGRWRPEQLAASATIEGDEVVLDGEKAYVEAIGAADHILVTARNGDGVSQVLVPAATSGMAVVPGRSIDMTRRFGRVTFSGARLPVSAIVGQSGTAAMAIERQLQLALALQCAEMVGVADRALELTLEYGHDRIAFGRPIVSFQALKHRIADMAVRLEGSNAVSDELAAAVDEQRDGATVLASVAKAYVGEHCLDIVDDCVQITGGMGVTWEHDLHLYSRRALLGRATYGTPEEHKAHLVGRIDPPKIPRPDVDPEHTVESLEAFDARARAWITANLPSLDDEPVDNRELQHLLFDHGFAGIAFPKEYGGGGLTLQHQKVFFDAVAALSRQAPATYHVSIGMLGPTILEHGSHEAKTRFLPPLLRGDEVWIQLLSEPRGGSDMAGAVTRLTSNGDSYIVTGAKMWSTGAHLADYGLCLCRSDWDVPKHQGLSMIAVPLQHTAGVTIEQIRAADGTRGDFCQEFFDDVRVPRGNLIGDENQGWVVAQALLLHERNAVANIGYGYLTGSPGLTSSTHDLSVPDLVVTAGQRGVDGVLAGHLADAYVATVVGPLLSARISAGIRLGTHKGQWGSVSKLHSSASAVETARTALGVDGPDGIVWDGDEVRLDNAGTRWLGIRGHTLAGGSNEMQRNIISERLLGLPREPSSDRELPFSEVLRRASGR